MENHPFKILIGSPIRQDNEILKEFLLSLLNLKIPFEADYLFIDNNIEDNSVQTLKNFHLSKGNVKIIYKNNPLIYKKNEISHTWTNKLIWEVADYRNLILYQALYNNYDYAFIVDSDIMLHPDTLLKLLYYKKDIISEILWTKWRSDSMEFPQVWLYDTYSFYDNNICIEKSKQKEEAIKFFNMLREPGIYEVGGLGACTLISNNAIKSGVNYSKISNLNMFGEDRHFCIRASVLGFKLYVDTNYPAFHIFRKSELNTCIEYKKKCLYKELAH